MVPREVHILIPGTWDYVTLQGKGDFATVMMLRIWGLGDNPGRSRWTHCHHRVLYRREAGKVREGAVVAEAEVRAMGAKEHRKLPETGKGKQILPDSALEPPEEAARLTSCL